MFQEFFRNLGKPTSAKILPILRLMLAEVNNKYSQEKNSLVYVDRAIARYLNENNKPALLQAASRYVLASKRMTGLELLNEAILQVQTHIQMLNQSQPPIQLTDALTTICCANRLLNFDSFQNFVEKGLLPLYGRDQVLILTNINSVNSKVKSTLFETNVTDEETTKLLFDYAQSHGIETATMCKILQMSPPPQVQYPSLGQIDTSLIKTQPTAGAQPQFSQNQPNIPGQFNSQQPQFGLQQSPHTAPPQFGSQQPSQPPQFTPQQPPQFGSQPPQFTPQQPPQFQSQQPPQFSPQLPAHGMSGPPVFTPPSYEQDEPTNTSTNTSVQQNPPQIPGAQNLPPPNFDPNLGMSTLGIQTYGTTAVPTPKAESSPKANDETLIIPTDSISLDGHDKLHSSAASFENYAGSTEAGQSYKYNENLPPLVSLPAFPKENWQDLQDALHLATSYD